MMFGPKDRQSTVSEGGVRRTPLLLAAVAAALAACGSATATLVASTQHAAGASCTQPRVVSEHAKGTTIHLCLGEKLVVRLHSTYWSSATTSSPAVLRRTGRTIVQPAPPTTCVPGAGCGTSTTRFVAAAHGKARVTAQRQLCGEAVQCRTGQRSFVLFVVVRR